MLANINNRGRKIRVYHARHGDEEVIGEISLSHSRSYFTGLFIFTSHTIAIQSVK
jgi:hypothetical protein